MYNNLKPLCDALTVDVSEGLSTQAASCLQALTGEKAEFQFDSGSFDGWTDGFYSGNYYFTPLGVYTNYSYTRAMITLDSYTPQLFEPLLQGLTIGVRNGDQINRNPIDGLHFETGCVPLTIGYCVRIDGDVQTAYLLVSVINCETYQYEAYWILQSDFVEAFTQYSSYSAQEFVDMFNTIPKTEVAVGDQFLLGTTVDLALSYSFNYGGESMSRWKGKGSSTSYLMNGTLASETQTFTITYYRTDSSGPYGAIFNPFPDSGRAYYKCGAPYMYGSKFYVYAEQDYYNLD